MRDRLGGTVGAKGYCLHWQREGVCNTGDTFLTELSDVKGDVVDMEAYAQAWVCRTKNTPFIAVKYVTDIIGQNSVKHWEDKLADARKGLGAFSNLFQCFEREDVVACSCCNQQQHCL